LSIIEFDSSIRKTVWFRKNNISKIFRCYWSIMCKKKSCLIGIQMRTEDPWIQFKVISYLYKHEYSYSVPFQTLSKQTDTKTRVKLLLIHATISGLWVLTQFWIYAAWSIMPTTISFKSTVENNRRKLWKFGDFKYCPHYKFVTIVVTVI